MDDQNPFESKYGSGAATPAPAKSAASGGNENPFEATYGDSSSQFIKDQAYENKIESYRPVAEEQT